MSDHFFPDSAIPMTVLDPGKVSRKIKAHDGSLMLVEVDFATGGVGAAHVHPHEQATYCLSGEFSFTVGDETRRLVPGDTVYIPAGARHCTTCLAAGKLLDIFTPQREDFLK